MPTRPAVQPILFLLVFLLLRITFVQAQCSPAGMAGTYSIGPTGTFATLQEALDSLHKKGISNAVVLELQATYNSSVETFPIVAKNIPCSEGGKRVTVRPAPNATSLRIASNDALTTLHLANATYLVIDGRPGGTGTTAALTISNSNTTGNAVRFTNDASYNQLKYLLLKGASRGRYNGVVYIGGSDSARGNDHNRIDTCTITGETSLPEVGVFSWGSLNKPNTGNVINGCHLPDIFSSLDHSYGILVNQTTDSIVITNNSFYQTAARSTATDRKVKLTGIWIDDQFSGGHVISGNFIGGNAPRATGTLEINGDFAFTGIHITGTMVPTPPSIVSNNTITNLQLNSLYGQHAMIWIGGETGESIFRGECRNNRVGNIDATQTVVVEPQKDHGMVTGIKIDFVSSDSLLVDGNHVGGFTSLNPLNSISFSGISFFTGSLGMKCRVSNNVIGSTNRPNSFYIRRGGSISGMTIGGTSSTVRLDTIVVDNNTIANLSFADRAVFGSIYGIAASPSNKGQYHFTRNTIHSLTINADGPTVAGISVFQGASTHSTYRYEQNNIYQLVAGGNMNPTSTTSVAGIHLYGNNTAQVTHEISRNYIHHLYAEAPAPQSAIHVELAGILLKNPTSVATVDNNMIYLGTDTLGNSYNAQTPFVGIYDIYGSNKFLHNTVVISGQCTNHNSDFPYTAAYIGWALDKAPRVIMNNIFINNRSNTAATGTKQASLIYWTWPIPNLQSDYNLLWGKGNGYLTAHAIIPAGIWDYPTLVSWRSLSGIDAHSIQKDPAFIKDSGRVSDVNLHVQNPSPVDTAGTASWTTALDFDGEQRALATPVDIGADGGLFGVVVNPTPTVDLQNRDFSVKVFPNPLTQVAYLQIYSRKPAMAQWAVYTINGTLVTSSRTPIRTGDNIISLPAGQWPSGLYLLQVTIDKSTGTTRLIK